MDAAISRGTVSEQNREDTITQGTLCAYELAQQYDPNRGPFEHQLRYVLSRRLRSSRSTDALDYAAEIEEVAPAQVAIPAEADVSIDLQARIDRLPSVRYKTLARLAFVEKRTIGIISRRTGLHKWYLQKHLTIISRLLLKG